MLPLLLIVTTVVVLSGSAQVVIVAEQQLLPIPQVMVAIGDSFASGNGANRYDKRVPECFRSPSSWAAQFATLINKNGTFINHGCSDGLFADTTRDRYLGSVRKDLQGNCPVPPSDLDDFYTEQEGSRKCDHFVQPQILSIDTTVDLVLFALGANDLQFKDLVGNCFLAVFRDASGCQAQMDFIRTSAATWTQNLTDILISMAPLLKPTARVIVLQYPHLALDRPYTYNPILGGSLEMTNNLRSLGFVLDDSQRSAIDMANQAVNRTFVLYYDQAKTLFAGHEPTSNVFSRNRDGWIAESWGYPLQELYHLNPTGHAQLAGGLYNFMLPLFTPTGPSSVAPVPAPV